jgi:hypothetical protein
MIQKFGTSHETAVSEVEIYVSHHTPYLRKHMTEALCMLESQGKARVAAIKKDGKRRRANSFPSEALVTFL